MFNRNYYLKDHLGSNRTTINSLGVVTNVQDYYAYGEVLRSYNNSTPNEKYKFTGKERDTETDLDYFGARYYDSELGRWLSVDPLASKYPAWSPYNYCVNNPLIYVDPNGTFADPIMQDGNDNIGGEDEKTKKAREDEEKKNKQKTQEKNSISQFALLLTTFGITLDAQQGIISLAGELDKGTAKVVSGMKSLGKTVGLLGVGLDGYDWVQNPSFEQSFKLGVSTLIVFGKTNPWIAAGKGIADVTGVSRPVEKAVGEIPSSIKNSLNQINLDMNNLLIPTGF